ncbi:hypothetical protein F4604DRAFT_2042436 [Suillus subluteus]|nr:hypothetical protein F4604DRAFT_2042436 [Suillus subluteus]
MSPAGETGTSSTPPRANAPAHGAIKTESTPNSCGASVVSENIGVLGAKVKKVRPWIQRDIEQVKQCKADAMLQALLQRACSTPETEQPELLQKCLKAVLPVCNGQASTALVKSSDVEIALNEYVRPGAENKFYSPFIRATNIALACLEEIKVDGMRAPVPAVDMICQQNDMPMHQNHQTAKSTRKPDLVILPINSACAPFKDEKGKQKDDEKCKKKRKAHMDTTTAKPKYLPWKGILACIEFKRKTPGRTKGINPPPLALRRPQQHNLRLTLHCCPAFQARVQLQAQGHGHLGIRRNKSKMKHDEKEADTDADLDVTVQMGLYAAEMFASNLGVNYLLNIIVIDDIMWIWYYDRQGIVQCSGINFIQDLSRFMVLLYDLQRFDLHDWGRNKDFLPVQVEGKQCNESKIKDVELGEVDLLLQTSYDERVTHYGPQRQATNVVPVTSEVLAKFTNHPTSRSNALASRKS